MKTPSRVLDAAGTKIKNGKSKGIWLWDASFIASRPDDVLSKCSQSHFTEIYLPYATVKATVAQYQYFIGKASSLGIQVHALDGDATWALSTGQNSGLTVIDNVNTYNNQSTADQKFKAIHFDVEPHQLNGTGGYPNNWNTDKVGTIDQWITNSDAWIARAKSYNLVMGGAFVHWLDDTASAPVPARFGTKKVSEIMIDKYDYYAVMAYNDSKTAVKDLANTEVTYAASAKVIVGIETIDTSPASVTFFQEGFWAADQAVQYVDGAFQSNAGYRGMAIHDFAQWEKFLAPYLIKNATRTKTPVRFNTAR